MPKKMNARPNGFYGSFGPAQAAHSGSPRADIFSVPDFNSGNA
jgi:hypothetical protein